MWAGTGESQEFLASALGGDGQNWELGENLHRDRGVALPPGQAVGEDCKRSPSELSLVCGGAIESWLIVHQKVTVGLG